MSNLKDHKTWDKEKFISKAIEIHGNKFDYSLVTEFNNYKCDNVKIKCNTCGSIFEIRPFLHIRNVNGGCKVCSKNNRFHNINDISELTCQYCSRIFKSVGAKKSHESICKLNPNRIARTSYQKYDIMTNDELINFINVEYKDKNISIDYISSNNSSLLAQLRQRDLMDIVFPNRKKDRPYKHMTDDEIITEINKYNKKGDVPNSLKTELIKRNIEWPDKFIFTTYKYNKLTDDELINIINTLYKNKNEGYVAQYDTPLIKQLAKRNLLQIAFPNRRKINGHSKYIKMTDDEIINIVKTKYKNKKLSWLCDIDKPLVNQIRKRQLLDIIFPDRMKFMSKQDKLDLLTKYDLQSMDWAVILDLIGEEKLPNEFRKLVKFGPNTPGRKQMIEDLKETYNIDLLEEENNNEEDDIIETAVDNIENEDNIYNEEINDELNPMKEIQQISELLKNDDEKIFTTGDKWLHIIRKQMNKLWNLILRDNENHLAKNIEIIKSKLNDSNITKFEKYVYEEFMKEYNEVINLEVH